MQHHGILQRDEQREQDYQTIKPLFDQLHEKFIQQSLEQSAIDRSAFSTFYEAYKSKIKTANLSEKEKTDLKDELASLLKNLREQIVTLYALTAEHWKQTIVDAKGKPFLGEKGYKILTEKGILEALEKEYENDPDKKKVISNFKGFFTYFSGFNQNRENYYSSEEKSTSVAHRIVNENLIFFSDNALLEAKFADLDLTAAEKQIFKIDFYNRCLTQEGINAYNTLIGTINSKINLYRQQNQTKLPFLKELYKCIGSKTEGTIPFLVIESDENLKETIQEMLGKSNIFLAEITTILQQIFENEEELDKVWISKTSLSRLSNRYLKNWFAFAEKGVTLKIFKENKKGEEKITVPAHVSLAEVREILESVKEEELFKPHREERRGKEADNRKAFVILLQQDIHERYQLYLDEQQKVQAFLPSLDKTNKTQKDSIKTLGDQAIFLLRFLKVFKVKADSGLDLSEIYNKIDHIIANFPLTKQYDAIRNYLTKKPFSEEKMKLNFDCSTLLGGWDVNKETQNLSVILRKNGKFYLAIMKKENNTLFDPQKNPSLFEHPDEIEKLEYKLLPGPNKMLPKVFFSQKGLDFFKPTEKILSLYQKGTFKKGKDFNVQDLHALIDFYKEALEKHEERGRVFNFSFKPTHQYEDVSQFYAEVEQQGYKLSRR